MKTRGPTQRILSWLLALAMCLSLLPGVALAEGETTSSTWTQVDLADVTSSDKIAITMTTSDGITYVLPNADTSSKAPSATIATASGSTLTISASGDDYAWTFTSADGGGYYITSPSGSYLYTTAANNGVRVGSTVMVWTLDGNYLSAVDSKNATRWLGVYTTNPDWRAYTSTTGNIAGQTLMLYKLTDGTEPTPEPTPDPTPDPTPEPTTEPTPADGRPANGDVVAIYHPASGMVMTSTASDTKLAGIAGTVEDGKLTVEDAVAMLTVAVEETGYYTFATDGKYLTSGETGNSLSFSEELTDCGRWNIVDAGDGTYYIKNVGANYNGNYNQSLEYYNGFTTYGHKDTDVYKFQFFTDVAVSDPEPDVPDAITTGTYVIWAPVYGKALSSTTNGSGYYLGVDVSGTATAVGGYGNTELWKVTNLGDGTYTVEQGGLYLGTTSNNYLTLAEDPANKLWTVEVNGDYYNLKCGNRYLEWYSSYNDWSMYSTISDSNKDMFALWFTPAAPVYDTDPDVVEAIAAWGGGGPYNENNSSVIYGDKYTVGDMLDTAAAFTVVANGQPAQPYQEITNTGTGGTNYYMGGTGLGSGTDDYMQLAVSTAGWGGMELSFRLRASGTGAGEWQLTYSTDGVNFENFTTGTSAYTKYGSDGTSSAVSSKIDDGVAKTSLAPEKYVSFTFDVPAGAENAKTLYIRLVPGTETNAKGTGTPGARGTIRIDSVVLSGSPIVDDSITGYVTVTPDGVEEDQAPGTELTMSSATEGATIWYRFNGKGEWQTYDESSKPVLPGTLPATLEVKATKEGLADSVTRILTYAAGTVSAVKMSPNGGGVYIENSDDTVDVTLSCETEDVTIYYSTDGGESYQEYTTPITLTKGFGSLTVKAYATKDGFNSSAVITRTFTERSQESYNLYFGQLHSHTSYSDGAGTCEDAFQHASELGEEWNIDFLAVTDHSNSFDNADSASIDDGSVSEEWTEGHELAEKYTTDGSFVGLFGFEMTWSNGLGHINTFNTPGFQSRTQSEYSTYSTALQNYYATLKTVSDSLSQFNHPGTTFGDFSDFSYYDEEIDDLITLIEVGNGEGAIGSSGYFPSYEYYTRALDKGWHVAPSNNQDNHKGNWGDSNTGRTVILADELTEEAIYDAVRNYRVYATEDLNLEIRYTLDGNVMGSILDGAADDTVKIAVGLADQDDTGDAKVEVIVNGGLSLASATASCNETVEFEVPADYSYYYIKVTQADGDIAVTAPVWIGEVEAVGISSLTAGSELTVAGEEQTFTLELYNNENSALTVDSIIFTDKATGEVLYTDSTISSVAKLSTASCSFGYTFATDGIVTITATVEATLDGVDKTYTQDLEVTVMPAEIVTKIIVDGTHYNDYVTGYYGGNMGNMTSIAAASGVKVEVVNDKITAEMLEDCSLLVISAPARKSGTANAGDYSASTFEDSFIELVKDYVKSGGSVVVCGLADYQDKNATNGADGHAAAQINKLLEAIGSTMSINDDEVYDPVNNGGQFYRLYPTVFNTDSPWTAGIVEGQTYSQYSGCSVNAGEGTWLVRGFDTTYSVDSDKDGVGNTDEVETDDSYGYNIVTPRGDVVFLASEETAYGGTIFAAGGVFLSDFEVKAELDNIWDLPYANRTIYETILGALCSTDEVTDIAEVRKADLNRVFVIEGYVTNGTADENTTFFDAIYVQDDTGGITVFPYSTAGLEIGTKVRIIGYTDAYQDDREIQVISLKILDGEPKVYEPVELSTEDAMDYDTYGGQLVSTTGVVSDIIQSNGTVSQFKLTDSTGVAATVFIDGYITNEAGENTIGTWIKDGDTVSAVGLLYKHPEGSSDVSVAVLRVRNCDEIVLISAASDTPTVPVVPVVPGILYTVTVLPADNGSVTASRTSAGKGTTVTLTATPDEGYLLSSLTVTDAAGNVLTLTDKGSGTYTFTMPASKVTVAAVFETTAHNCASEVFTDVDTTQYYHAAVDWAVLNGITTGTSETTFSPDASCTRAQMMTFLWRAAGSPAPTGTVNPFTDVDSGAYYYDAVLWAVENGITTGTGATTFSPDETVTRGQTVTFLYRYAGSPAVSGSNDFTDVPADAYYADAVQWAVTNGVTNGTGATTFSPESDCTRAQIVTLLYRYIAE